MKKIFSLSKTTIYWLLQIFGWFSISLSGFLNQLFLTPDNLDYMDLIHPINISLPGIIITHVYKEKFISPYLFTTSFLNIFLAGVKGIFLVSLAVLIFSNLYYLFIYNEQEYLITKLIFIQFLNAFVYIGGWFVIYFFYKILERSKEISSKKLQLEMKAKSSELELLKAQLNPEFLFQSLNSLRIMALKDKKTARDAIIKLSELLRFSLNYEKKPLISLEQELTEVKKYLELNQINQDNKLTFTFDVKEEVKNQSIPTALLLALNEQIVQNMFSDINEMVQLNISISVKDEKVYIANSIQSKNVQIRTLDFSKAKKRLQNYFGTEANITVQKLNSNFVSVNLTYPTNPLKIEEYELQSYNHR